jgi:hypothetical protein
MCDYILSRTRKILEILDNKICFFKILFLYLTHKISDYETKGIRRK